MGEKISEIAGAGGLEFWFFILLKEMKLSERKEMSDMQNGCNDSDLVFDDISTKSIYRQIGLDSDLDLLTGDAEALMIGKNFMSPLIRIEEFVKKSLQSKTAIYNTGLIDSLNHEEGLTSLGKMLLPFYSSIVECYDNRFDYSEYVNVFFESLKIQCEKFNLGFGGYLFDIPGEIRYYFFNGLVEKIRESCNSKVFRRKLAVRKYRSKENFKSALELIEELFKKRSRLLVLRVDFGYRIEVRGEINEISAGKHRENFLNNMRSNTIFRNLLGYIWKLEYGAEKGHHYHFAFFFDGANVRNDAFKADQIGRCWEKITRGWGTHYNCNRSKCKYKHIGIGMISHDDLEMQKNLRMAVSYLAKKDQYLRGRYSKKTRVFHTSRAPKPALTRAGRPRKGVDTPPSGPQLKL